MRNEELKAVFDQLAPDYEKQWERMAPIRDGLHFILESLFVALPENARILCVGAGTGAEVAHLARKFPSWRFTAVEPSGAMLEICRQRAAAERFASRCNFHEGYLDSLPTLDMHDAATCFLVASCMAYHDVANGHRSRKA
jgi:tRNA (cmo5U34)-methyltransferase